MNSLIQELTTELKSNTQIKDSIVVKVVLESINNSVLLGVASSDVLENALSTLDQLAQATVNENLKEVVAKFKKMAVKPTQRLQNMAKEAGISLKIKALKESAMYGDPTFKYTISKIEEKLASIPEFRLIGVISEALTPYSYDKNVANTISELANYVNENRAKLEVINAIFEMRQTSSMIYSESIAELENSLLENSYSSDTLKMKMRGKSTLPIVNRLINTLSMVESKLSGKFNIGLGNGDAKVNSIIAPFCKISESEAVVFVDNKFIKLTEEESPKQVEISDLAEFPEFVEVCEAFAGLNFQEQDNSIVTNGRNLQIKFSINENGNLTLFVNNNIVEDLTKMNLSELFVMEQFETRSKLTKIFNSLDTIVNLEFAKKIVNERLDKDSLVFTIGETLYIFEKLGQTRLIKKMDGLQFHNYVMENFKYDVSELYSIQLEDNEFKLREIEEDKKVIESDLSKLELSISKLEEALTDSTLSEEYQTQLSDLKVSIEKNVNSLKNHYIQLDQSKKKSINEAESITLVSPKTAKYGVGKRVVLNDNTSGTIIGIDGVSGTYLLITSDNRSIRVKTSDIESLEKPKDNEYQISGINPDKTDELSIKDTPFDLNQDK